MLGEGPFGPTAACAPLAVRHGQWSVARYATDLRDWVFWYSWPSTSLTDAFLLGLGGPIRSLMVAQERSNSQDGNLTLASQLELQVLAPGRCGQPSPPTLMMND